MSLLVTSTLLIDMQEAITSHKREEEARHAAEKLQASLSAELERVREEKLVAEHRVI